MGLRRAGQRLQRYNLEDHRFYGVVFVLQPLSQAISWDTSTLSVEMLMLVKGSRGIYLQLQHQIGSFSNLFAKQGM
jgi:hypothetical protein